MPTIYEVEGNLITRIDRTVTAVGRLSDLLPSLTTYRPIELGNLPRDCAYLKVEPTATGDSVEATVVIAQPPQKRRIIFNESGGRPERQQAYTLAMPYHLFWLRMLGTPHQSGTRTPTNVSGMLWAPRFWGTLWTQRPPRDIHTDLAIGARMPNTWADGRVCFGHNAVDANQTLGQYIDGLTNTYWTSLFNTDLGMNTPYGTAPRSSLAAWTRATEADAECWRNWAVWTNEARVIDIISGTDPARWSTPMPDSVEPVIPQTPRTYTFHSVRQWLFTQMTEEQRQRILWTLQNDAIPEAEAEPPPWGAQLAMDPEPASPSAARP